MAKSTIIQVTSVATHARRGAMEFQNAKSRWTERKACIVQVSSAFHSGWGEAAPLPGYSIESYDAVEASIPNLLPFELDLSKLRASIAKISDPLRAGSMSSLAFALESAALDLAARHLSTSVASLLSACPGEASTSVLFDAEEDVPSNIKRARRLGARAIKVKLSGRCTSNEIESLRRLISEAGDLAVRVDANGSIAAEDLARHTQTLRTLKLEFVEEPGAFPWPLDHLAPGLAYAADESLALCPDLDLLLPDVRSDLLKFAVIKPARVGGVFRALELARWAEAHGLVAIISHLLDGPIAMAMYGELACVVGDKSPHGLGLHPGIAALGSRMPPQFAAGRISAHHFGLGVDLNS